MIAVKRLQSLFWLLLVALGALGAYLVSLRVATERNELMHVRTQIAAARADIRYLETEFGARANMRQLEQWNAEDFRYAAPTSDHYLDGERALAHLDGLAPDGTGYVAQPVLVAMTDAGDGDKAESAAKPAPAPVQAVLRTADAPAPRLAGVETLKLAGTAASAPARVALSAPAGKTLTKAGESLGSPARKAERMAMLDARLLDDRTLGDIGRRAAAEITGGRR